MRVHDDWMTQADERILELLRESGPRQPKQLTNELAELGFDYNDKYVGRRCRSLKEHGLLRDLGNGVYQITEFGEQFLDGELSKDDLGSDGEGTEP